MSVPHQGFEHTGFAGSERIEMRTLPGDLGTHELTVRLFEHGCGQSHRS